MKNHEKTSNGFKVGDYAWFLTSNNTKINGLILNRMKIKAISLKGDRVFFDDIDGSFLADYVYKTKDDCVKALKDGFKILKDMEFFDDKYCIPVDMKRNKGGKKSAEVAEVAEVDSGDEAA